MCVFFSIVFFAYAIVVMKGKSYIYDYVDKECAKPTGYFGDYDRAHIIAE